MYCTPSNSENQHNRETRWIDEEIRELCEIDEEIAEDGLPPIKDSAKLLAKRVLVKLDTMGIDNSPYVYPTMDGEIAINFKSQNYSLLILIINKNNIESYSSFFNSDTEYNSFTAPFEDFFDFMKTQLHRLNEMELQKEGSKGSIKVQ